MHFYIYTLGCKVNTYESEIMKELLLKEGFLYDEEKPDIVIVNTCTVTNTADNKSMKMVRHFKKLFPKYIIFIEKNEKYITLNNEDKLIKYVKEGKINYILVSEKNDVKTVDVDSNRYDEFLIKEYFIELVKNNITKF